MILTKIFKFSYKTRDFCNKACFTPCLPSSLSSHETELIMQHKKAAELCRWPLRSRNNHGNLINSAGNAIWCSHFPVFRSVLFLQLKPDTRLVWSAPPRCSSAAVTGGHKAGLWSAAVTPWLPAASLCGALPPSDQRQGSRG